MTRRQERGAAATEMALFLPVLLFTAAAAGFVVQVLLGHLHVTEVTMAGARYATRAALDPEIPSYRFRPTAAEVESYVRRAAEDRGLPVESVVVDPSPDTALPGDEVTVTVSARVELGPLGRLARAFFPAFSGGCAEDALCVRSTATMREE